MEDADNYKALKTLGWLYKSEGKGADAIKYLKVAYVKAPEDEELLVWLDELGITAQHVRDIIDDGKYAADDDEDFGDMDGFNYNVEDNINEAHSVISEVIGNLSNLSGAGAAAAQAQAQAEKFAEQHPEVAAQAEGPAIISLPSSSDEPTISDDDIEKLMAAANAANAAKAAEPSVSKKPTEVPILSDTPTVSDEELAKLFAQPAPAQTPETSEEDEFSAALKQFDQVAMSVDPASISIADMAKAAASISDEEAAPFIPTDLVSSVYEEAGLDPDDPFGDEPIMPKGKKGEKP
jgi:hypothetical protein